MPAQHFCTLLHTLLCWEHGVEVRCVQLCLGDGIHKLIWLRRLAVACALQITFAKWHNGLKTREPGQLWTGQRTGVAFELQRLQRDVIDGAAVARDSNASGQVQHVGFPLL